MNICNYFKKIFIAISVVLMMTPSVISINADNLEYTEWADEKTNLPGEQERTVYRYRDFVKSETSKNKLNNESVQGYIYYIDTEYVFFQNGKYNSSTKTAAQPGRTITLADGNKITTEETFWYNKYNIKDEPNNISKTWVVNNREVREKKGDTSMSVRVDGSIFPCYSDSCGRLTTSDFSTAFTIDKSVNTTNYRNDILFATTLYSLGSTGTSAATGPRPQSGYRVGLTGSDAYSTPNFVGEMNEYNRGGDGACGVKGWGNGSTLSNWCYENRYANKTYSIGDSIDTTIHLSNGVDVVVEGFMGTTRLYGGNRQNGYAGSDGYTPVPLGTSDMDIYGLSIIERNYYLSPSTPTPGTEIGRTWLTNTYTDWSSWSTTKPTAASGRQIQEKKQYRHPKWQYATVDFVDVDRNNTVLETSERLQGMPNAEIKYDKLNDKISFYTNEVM